MDIHPRIEAFAQERSASQWLSMCQGCEMPALSAAPGVGRLANERHDAQWAPLRWSGLLRVPRPGPRISPHRVRARSYLGFGGIRGLRPSLCSRSNQAPKRVRVRVGSSSGVACRACALTMNDPDKPDPEPTTIYADPKATLQARGVADADGLERPSAFVATTNINPLTDRSPTPRQTIAEALAAASETTPAFHRYTL